MSKKKSAAERDALKEKLQQMASSPDSPGSSQAKRAVEGKAKSATQKKQAKKAAKKAAKVASTKPAPAPELEPAEEPDSQPLPPPQPTPAELSEVAAMSQPRSRSFSVSVPPIPFWVCPAFGAAWNAAWNGTTSPSTGGAPDESAERISCQSSGVSPATAMLVWNRSSRSACPSICQPPLPSSTIS